jgi:hypothetical protein
MERTLCEIAGAIGTPLVIDNTTKNRVFGHYARLLVDMDLSRNIFHEIMVEKEGYAFPAEVVYEWLPEFCTHCKSIGHSVITCSWLHPQKGDKIEKV